MSKANVGTSPKSFRFLKGQGLEGTIVRPTEAIDITSACDRRISRIDSRVSEPCELRIIVETIE